MSRDDSTADVSLFARLYDPVMALPERWLLADHRASLAEGLSGRVLDLGTGTGAMLPHLAACDDLSVHAVDPDPGMRRQARERAAALDVDVTFTGAPAEELPYPEDSFDAAVVALVLCTVSDVGRALDELARVLRPGGELRFLEHVRGRGAVGALHDGLAPGWYHVAGGCNLDRETGDRLTGDDRFELLEYTRLESGPWRALPVVRGRLERRGGSRLPL